MAGRTVSLTAVLLGLLLLQGAAFAGEPASGALIREVGQGRVDWAACEVQARAGAAADPRMPSPALARPGAERRARAAALARLRTALEELPLGAGRKPPHADVERALGRALADRVEYQSNGGVVVTMMVRFRDLQEASPSPDAGAPEPAAVLAVSATALEAAPLLEVGGREVVTGSACYRQGPAPAAVTALPAQRDSSGRLKVKGDAALAERLAGAPVLIYFQKVAR